MATVNVRLYISFFLHHQVVALFIYYSYIIIYIIGLMLKGLN